MATTTIVAAPEVGVTGSVFVCTDTAHLAARSADVGSLAESVAAHEQQVRDAVGRHGGRLWPRTDGSGGVFDDLHSAVRAAVQIARDGGPGDGAGVAIDIGDATSHGGRPVGPGPLRAGRLSALAGSGVIAVSEPVVRALAIDPVTGVTLRPLGPWDMPGLGRVHVHALDVGGADGDAAALAGAPRRGAALHRSDEAAIVREVLASPGSGGSGLVLVGEAGIGKSAVWRDAVADARRLGMRVLVAAADGPGEDRALGLLHDLLADVTAEELAVLPTLQREALEAVLMRRAATGPTPRDLVVAAVDALIAALCERRPVVVAVDDLPWAAADSARVLDTVLARCADRDVVLLATERVGAGEVAVDWTDRLGPLPCRRHVVEPMAPADLADVLRVHLDDPRSLHALERIAGDAEGNPLLALELARTDRRTDAAGGSTVERVRHRVGHRLRDLGPDAVRLLSQLAVAPWCGVDELVAATPDLELGRAVADAQDAGLVVVDGARLRFAHPVQRHAVLESLDAPTRRDIHGRLATVVVDPVDRAVHLGAAALLPDVDVAATVEDGARVAAGRGAVAAAASLAERAVELTPSAHRSDRLRRLQLAAVERWQEGDRERCLALLDDADDVARSHDDRARVLVMRSRLWDVRYPPDADVRAALSWRDVDPETLVQLHLAVVLLDLSVMDNVAAARVGRGGLAIADRAGTPDAVRWQLAGLTGFAEALTGSHEGWSLMEEAARCGPDRSSPAADLQNDPRTFLGMAKMHRDDLDGARELLEDVLSEAEGRGSAAAVTVIGLMVVHTAVRDGRLDDAERVMRRLRRGAGDAATDMMDLGTAYVRALVAVARGDADAAASAAAAAAGFPVDMTAWSLVALAAPGQVALAHGDAATADEVLGPLVAVEDRVRGRAQLVPIVHRVRGDAAEAAILVGDLDRAGSLVADLEELRDRFGAPWAAVAAARARVLLELARGADDAGAAADRAVALAAGHPVPVEVARTMLTAGIVHRARGARAIASGLIEEARAIFDRVGCVAWRDRADRELARTSGRRAEGCRDGLSATQDAIAALAANGLTNREIAARLHLGQKTVENNLTAIYRALGVRSRTELAATW